MDKGPALFCRTRILEDILFMGISTHPCFLAFFILFFLFFTQSLLEWIHYAMFQVSDL